MSLELNMHYHLITRLQPASFLISIARLRGVNIGEGQHTSFARKFFECISGKFFLLPIS